VKVLTHTWWMVVRQVRNLQREPVWVILLVVQPIIWLALYGQLFSRVTQLRGGTTTYIEFLAPGIVCMNAFFGGSWAGMAMINDLHRNVVDRFLASPASRLSIVLSQVVRAGLVAIVQALILLGIGYALGVRVHGGLLGWLVVLAAAALLAMVFAGISNGIALLVRQEASMIATAQFVSLPLMFLSSILIARPSMPGWMQAAASYNPVDWGVRAARNAVVLGGDWGKTGIYLAALAAASAVTTAFATWTFRVYQRSL
jgi:ABC-2 type transport system permease protein